MNLIIDKKIKISQKNGFALPTVLVASIVMLAVLLLSVVSVSAVRSALNEQYYNQLARTAGEAGTEYAKACLAAGNGVALWVGKTLKPNTDCSGSAISGANEYIVSSGIIKTSFTVDYPSSLATSGIVSNGSTGLFRTGEATAWRTYAQTTRLARAVLPLKQITAGYAHVCAIAFDSQAYCWGLNGNGQLGNGTRINSSIPVLVSGIGTVKFIATGSAHTCAINTDNQVYCWGINDLGELGNTSISSCGGNNHACSLVPVAVNLSSLAGGEFVVSLAAGDTHTCGLTSLGSVYCWGNNGYGQLGRSDNNQMPIKVDSTTTFKAITAGHGHTCGLTSLGSVYCWGNNGYGQLGNANYSSYNSTPLLVAGLTNVTLLMSGSGNTSHTCAITTDNKAWCWGRNNTGQLGHGTNESSNSTPTVVSGGYSFKNISASDFHTCAITTDNKAWCWGSNYGDQLGNGSTSDSSSPTQVNATGVLSGKSLASIAVGPDSGSGFSCSVDSDSKTYCWGMNTFGEFGNNTFSTTPNPYPQATQVPPYLNYIF